MFVADEEYDLVALGRLLSKAVKKLLAVMCHGELQYGCGHLSSLPRTSVATMIFTAAVISANDAVYPHR